MTPRKRAAGRNQPSQTPKSNSMYKSAEETFPNERFPQPPAGYPALASGYKPRRFVNRKGSAAAIVPWCFALGRSFCKPSPKRQLAQDGSKGPQFSPRHSRRAGLSICWLLECQTRSTCQISMWRRARQQRARDKIVLAGGKALASSQERLFFFFLSCRGDTSAGNDIIKW